MKARAVNPRKPHEMTRAEMAWASFKPFTEAFDHRRYEAITLRLGDVRYTADFSGVCRETGQLCLFEVKPSDHLAVYTDIARLRLKAFASEFGEIRFFVCWPLKGSKLRRWHVEEIPNRTCRLDISGSGPNFAQETPTVADGSNYQDHPRKALRRKARAVSGNGSPAALPGQASFLEDGT